MSTSGFRQPTLAGFPPFEPSIGARTGGAGQAIYLAGTWAALLIALVAVAYGVEYSGRFEGSQVWAFLMVSLPALALAALIFATTQSLRSRTVGAGWAQFLAVGVALSTAALAVKIMGDSEGWYVLWSTLLHTLLPATIILALLGLAYPGDDTAERSPVLSLLSLLAIAGAVALGIRFATMSDNDDFWRFLRVAAVPAGAGTLALAMTAQGLNRSPGLVATLVMSGFGVAFAGGVIAVHDVTTSELPDVFFLLMLGDQQSVLGPPVGGGLDKGPVLAVTAMETVALGLLAAFVAYGRANRLGVDQVNAAVLGGVVLITLAIGAAIWYADWYAGQTGFFGFAPAGDFWGFATAVLLPAGWGVLLMVQAEAMRRPPEEQTTYG